ncbi:MAG: tetratricopeptide repeat protein [Gemmatimonadota bacterium]
MATGGGGYLPRFLLIAAALTVVSMGALYVLYDPPPGLSQSDVFGSPVARNAPRRDPVRPTGGVTPRRTNELPALARETPPERPAPPLRVQGAPGTTLDRARAAVGAGDYAAARRLFETLSERDRPFGVRREYARALAWGGQPQAAARELEALTSARPDDAGLWLELARYRWWAAQPVPARSAVLRVLDVRPGDVEATALLREIRGGLRPSAAEAAAWLAENDAPLERLWLGRALAREDRHGEALVHLRYAAWSGEFADSLWLEYAAAAAQADSAAATADALDRYAQRADPSRDVRVRLARALAWAGRTDEALATYSALLASADDPTLRIERARLLARQERWEEARRDLRTALAERPQDPDGLLLLADIEWWAGSSPDAARLYESALEARPDDQRAARGLELASAALEARPPAPDSTQRPPPAGRWSAINETFGDNQAFRWFSNAVTRTWFGERAVWSVSGRSDVLQGFPVDDLDLTAVGFALSGQARFTTSDRTWLTLGLGAHGFERAGTHPTATVGITWDPRPGTRLEAAYDLGPAVRRSATSAAVGADVMSHLVRGGVATRAGSWSLSVASENEFLASDLGETWRIGASLDARRPLGAGFSALAGVAFVGTTGDSPALDGDPLYWTPDYYVAPSVGLAYERKIGVDRFAGLRVRPSYVFVRERGPERRFFDEEVFFLGAGLDMNLAGDGWDVLASMDWTGAAFEDGYRGALLSVQWVTRPTWP